MSLSDNLLQQAEQYLDGSMTNTEKQAFETQLENNQELAEYIELNKEMQIQYNDEDWSFVDDNTNTKILEDYLKSEDAKTIKVSISKVNTDFVHKTPLNRKAYYSYFAIAASIALLIGYFIFNSSEGSLKIYSQYNDWSTLPSLTTRGNSDDGILVKGEDAFLAKDFIKSEHYFDTFLKNNAELNPSVLVYHGISNLELENYDEALKAFNKLIESNTLDRSKGYWYKALVYLKMDDRDNAVKQLDIITSNVSYYNYSLAKEILEKLN